jgi:hypothetical protein
LAITSPPPGLAEPRWIDILANNINMLSH